MKTLKWNSRCKGFFFLLLLLGPFVILPMVDEAYGFDRRRGTGGHRAVSQPSVKSHTPGSSQKSMYDQSHKSSSGPGIKSYDQGTSQKSMYDQPKTKDFSVEKSGTNKQYKEKSVDQAKIKPVGEKQGTGSTTNQLGQQKSTGATLQGKSIDAAKIGSDPKIKNDFGTVPTGKLVSTNKATLSDQGSAGPKSVTLGKGSTTPGQDSGIKKEIVPTKGKFSDALSKAVPEKTNTPQLVSKQSKFFTGPSDGNKHITTYANTGQSQGQTPSAMSTGTGSTPDTTANSNIAGTTPTKPGCTNCPTQGQTPGVSAGSKPAGPLSGSKKHRHDRPDLFPPIPVASIPGYSSSSDDPMVWDDLPGDDEFVGPGATPPTKLKHSPTLRLYLGALKDDPSLHNAEQALSQLERTIEKAEQKGKNCTDLRTFTDTYHRYINQVYDQTTPDQRANHIELSPEAINPLKDALKRAAVRNSVRPSTNVPPELLQHQPTFNIANVPQPRLPASESATEPVTESAGSDTRTTSPEDDVDTAIHPDWGPGFQWGH